MHVKSLKPVTNQHHNTHQGNFQRPMDVSAVWFVAWVLLLISLHLSGRQIYRVQDGHLLDEEILHARTYTNIIVVHKRAGTSRPTKPHLHQDGRVIAFCRGFLVCAGRPTDHSATQHWTNSRRDVQLKLVLRRVAARIYHRQGSHSMRAHVPQHSLKPDAVVACWIRTDIVSQKVLLAAVSYPMTRVCEKGPAPPFALCKQLLRSM
jgi:hypothetical protein